MSASTTIQEAVAAASDSYYRLVLVAGSHGSGKSHALRRAASASGWLVLNVGLVLARSLAGVQPSQRPVAVQELARQLLSAEETDVLVLDNVELLFCGSLRLQPLEFLKSLSRSRTLVVAWPGAYDGTTLTYAEPGWPEYTTFDASGVSVLPVESISDL